MVMQVNGRYEPNGQENGRTRCTHTSKAYKIYLSTYWKLGPTSNAASTASAGPVLVRALGPRAPLPALARWSWNTPPPPPLACVAWCVGWWAGVCGVVVGGGVFGPMFCVRTQTRCPCASRVHRALPLCPRRVLENCQPTRTALPGAGCPACVRYVRYVQYKSRERIYDATPPEGTWAAESGAGSITVKAVVPTPTSGAGAPLSPFAMGKTDFKPSDAEAWFERWESVDNDRQMQRSEAVLAAALANKAHAIPPCDVVLESVNQSFVHSAESLVGAASTVDLTGLLQNYLNLVTYPDGGGGGDGVEAQAGN